MELDQLQIIGRMVGMTVAEHDAASIVPKEVDTIYGNHKYIKECKDELDLLGQICNMIWELVARNYNIYCKGYNRKYNYDALLLYNASLRLGSTMKSITQTCWYCLRNACCCCPIDKYWNKTHEQIKKGDYKSNQEYLVDGIKHNIEDSYQLFSILDKYITIKNKKEAIKNDFKSSSK